MFWEIVLNKNRNLGRCFVKVLKISGLGMSATALVRAGRD